MTRVAVIDIGKTNAKVALVDLRSFSEIAVLRMPNRAVKSGLYPHHDVEGIWRFILESLAALQRGHGIDAISITTHGATAALIDGDDLTLPVLDYEFDGPDSVRIAYEKVRPLFEQTGSPALPLGLNLGAQLFWQSQTFPDAFAKSTSVLMYPQYWAWRLTGVLASEITSLGCHTDLWNPHSRDFSNLVDLLQWRSLFAPLRAASDLLGSLRPELARRIVGGEVPVYCGIHDSNASLLPHLATCKAPFAVVSTGTWVVSMAVGGLAIGLDPKRDTLINVDAFGRAVPSARFMGGREFETIMTGTDQCWSAGDFDEILADQIMLLPSLQQGSGPFPERMGGWTAEEPQGGNRFVAASFYTALMTATCLELIGAKGEVVVEGPFAANSLYVRMLSAATGCSVSAQAASGTGTSLGAAMLAGEAQRIAAPEAVQQTDRFDALRDYADLWRSRVSPS